MDLNTLRLSWTSFPIPMMTDKIRPDDVRAPLTQILGYSERQFDTSYVSHTKRNYVNPSIPKDEMDVFSFLKYDILSQLKNIHE